MEACLEAERIAEVLALPAGHPERRHAETCPRCRSLVDSYRAFLAAEPVEGSELEDVRGVLDAHIRAEGARWMPDARESRSEARRSRSSWWRAFLHPAPLAAAGVLALATVWWVARSPEESITRGSAPPAHGFLVHEAQVRPDGGILLSWSPVVTANRYEVRIYGPDLHEVYRSPDATDTSLIVPPATLPADLLHPVDLTWEVHARQGTDLIRVSPPGSIHLP